MLLCNRYTILMSNKTKIYYMPIYQPKRNIYIQRIKENQQRKHKASFAREKKKRKLNHYNINFTFGTNSCLPRTYRLIQEQQKV